MLLRRFEAYGFKSFADKVEVEFGAGVTAIVGPNGSGKSNISDAIRWVLGEQNVRNLRGAKTEDIIFAGSSERRSLNVAEVSLIFDNSDHSIPLDFSEVIITRRVYRSGESEYMINKASCRLKDIHDLLGDIGLGRESMAVISQNKVDEILNSRPEDRRLLFEDAAGITKYKHRKRDALRKLEDTENNLTRVADIMAELGSQLTPLAESAERTQQYNQYREQLTACQVSLLLNKIDRAQAMLGDINRENESLTDQFLTESTRLSTSEAEAEKLTHALAKIGQALEAQESDIAVKANDLEKAESRTAVLQERITQRSLAIERVNQDIGQLTEKRGEVDRSVADLQNSVIQKRQQIAAAEAELTAHEEQLALLLAQISGAEAEIAAANDSAFTNLQELSSQRNASVNLERDLVRYRSRVAHLQTEADETAGKLSAAKEQSWQLAQELDELANSLEKLAKDSESLSAARLSVNEEITSAQNESRRIAGQVTQCQSRLNVLAAMQRDLEGFSRGSKSVLTSQAPWRKGVCGAVAQLIDVPARYVTAVEIALGGALQDIVTEDESTVRSAIQYLKQQNAGRVTFLPLSNVKSRSPRPEELRAAKAAGAIGFAADLISCENRFRGIIEHLLGRVIVAEKLDDALAIARQSGFTLRIVTLEGELLNPGGAITGGSVTRRESSYLGRTGEIHSLEQTEINLKQQHAAAESMVGDLLKRAASLTNEEEELAGKRQAGSLRQAQLTAYRDQAVTEASRLLVAQNTINEEISQSMNEIAQLEQKLSTTKETIAALEQSDSNRKETVAAWHDQLRRLQQDKETTTGQSTEQKIALSTLGQEIVSIEQLLQRHQEDIRTTQERTDELQRERERVTSEIADAENEIAQLQLLRQSLSLEKQSLEKERLKLLGEKAEQLAALDKTEKEAKDLRRRSSLLESRLHELQLMLTRYDFDMTNSLEQLQEQYSLTIEDARPLCLADDPSAILSRVKQLEQDISLLGPVNPAAIDEYARAKERHGFLENQYQDLVTAKEHLTSIIGDIDATMSKQFISAFQTINTHFMDTFPRLFGGGKAQIELIDPDDPLQSGIEIYVQPPGKKQQNLALLSGGERALTVIAILFALLAFRPAPFTVVDEIDAALDEANVQRFSEFLREFSRNTQFIVVTHRKGTMEVADVMHGVTMEDSGVSRIVSVRFMDKAG